ncbi:HNH endonuclease [Nocardia salmonicida]|uniref:HNH endonuclease n=1 Tax=Nocardia salmonicida TaxID=53431 RepID=A0ABZ1NAV8_9NOCA
MTTADSYMRTSIGEVAHIFGDNPGSARHDTAMTPAERADPSNALWLCPTCHELIDKSGGTAYPPLKLQQWRDGHTAKVRLLLESSRQPALPELMRREQNASVVQHVFEALASKRTLHDQAFLERWPHVLSAAKELRLELLRSAREIDNDQRLRLQLRGIASVIQNFMKRVFITDGVPEAGEEHAQLHLEVMRDDIRVIVGQLAQEFKLRVPSVLQGENWYAYPDPVDPR